MNAFFAGRGVGDGVSDRDAPGPDGSTAGRRSRRRRRDGRRRRSRRRADGRRAGRHLGFGRARRRGGHGCSSVEGRTSGEDERHQQGDQHAGWPGGGRRGGASRRHLGAGVLWAASVPSRSDTRRDCCSVPGTFAGSVRWVSSWSWRSSSVVEQGTHKPLVGGSNPPSATRHDTERPVRSNRGPVRFAVGPPGATVSNPSSSAGATIRAGPPSVPMREGQDLRPGVVTATRRYTRNHRRRTVVARSTPEAPFEPQVLPQRHRDAGARRRHRGAAVHVDPVLDARPTSVGYSQFLTERPGRARSSRSRSRARRSRSSPRAGAPPYTVTVPAPIVTKVYDDMVAGGQAPAT